MSIIIFSTPAKLVVGCFHAFANVGLATKKFHQLLFTFLFKEGFPWIVSKVSIQKRPEHIVYTYPEVSSLGQRHQICKSVPCSLQPQKNAGEALGTNVAIWSGVMYQRESMLQTFSWAHFEVVVQNVSICLFKSFSKVFFLQFGFVLPCWYPVLIYITSYMMSIGRLSKMNKEW